MLAFKLHLSHGAPHNLTWLMPKAVDYETNFMATTSATPALIERLWARSENNTTKFRIVLIGGLVGSPPNGTIRVRSAHSQIAGQPPTTPNEFTVTYSGLGVRERREIEITKYNLANRHNTIGFHAFLNAATTPRVAEVKGAGYAL
jgi:hypothetical protein